MCYFTRLTANFLITRFEPDYLPKANLKIRKIWSLRPDFHRLAKAATTSIATAPSARFARSLLVRFPLGPKKGCRTAATLLWTWRESRRRLLPPFRPRRRQKVHWTFRLPQTSSAPSLFDSPLILTIHIIRRGPQPYGCGPLLNGPEGNRTPVRKSIPRSISHHSLYFDVPSMRRLKTNSALQ